MNITCWQAHTMEAKVTLALNMNKICFLDGVVETYYSKQ
jgi:hypothetical protein